MRLQRALAALAAALGPCLLLSTAAGEPPAALRSLLRLEQALELAFPGCEIERGTEYLTEEQLHEVERRAGTPLAGSIHHPYVATRDGALVGTAYVDTHRVRTLRESVLVVVDPRGRVGRVEVLSFAEPPDYLPGERWYAQFVGRPLDEELNLKRGIRGITGATLTAHATTDAVRRTLALHGVLHAESTPTPEETEVRAD